MLSFGLYSATVPVMAAGRIVSSTLPDSAAVCAVALPVNEKVIAVADAAASLTVNPAGTPVTV